MWLHATIGGTHYNMTIWQLKLLSDLMKKNIQDKLKYFVNKIKLYIFKIK